ASVRRHRRTAQRYLRRRTQQARDVLRPQELGGRYRSACGDAPPRAPRPVDRLRPHDRHCTAVVSVGDYYYEAVFASSFDPYSLSLLCSVFKLIPRISAARVLLFFVCSRVRRINPFSASSTVVPMGKRTASISMAAAGRGAADGAVSLAGSPSTAVGRCFTS